MSLRAKMKRRVRWCLIGTVALAGLSAGAYVVRDRHLAARAITDRDEGLRLLEAGDHFKAMHKIGPYVRRHPDDVDTLFAYARARLGAPEPDGKHLVDGISLMRRVRGLDPGHAAVTNELLELYGQVGWVTELQVLADELLAGDPAHPAALRARATALARARKFEDALKASSKYNELHPQDLDGQILTLTILSQCDRSRERLLAYAEKLNASKPDDLRLLVVRSLACQFAGDVGRAAELAKEAAASDMPDAATALLLSRQCNLLELFDVARSVLERASARVNDPVVDEALALRLWRDGLHEEVIARFPEARGEQLTGLRAARAMSLSELGRHEEARRTLDLLKQAGASDEVAGAWAVVIESRQAGATPDEKAVIAACQTALRHQSGRPQHAAAAAFFHCALGDRYARVGEMDSAVKSWRDAAMSASAWGVPLVRLSQVAMAGGRFDEARVLAEAAERRRSGDPEALLVQAGARITMLRAGDVATADDLLAFLDDAQKRAPGEERLVPLRAQTLARAGRSDDAKRIIEAQLASLTPAKAGVYLQLAAVSRGAKLGLEEECYDAGERAHGMTADLAYARAEVLADAGRPDEGLRLLETSFARAPAADVSWGTARARYFDRVDDPRAADAWRKLADAHPRDARVQWLSISAKALQSDRAYIGKALDRLKDLLGDEGLNWRIARARWLMDRAGSGEGAVQAALLLTEVTRAAPEVLAPRLLLADCLERMRNYRGAIDQLVAAANLQPDAPEIALKLGWLLHEQGETGRSRVYLDQVLANVTATPEQRRNAAGLVAAQGDPQHALNAIEGELAAENAGSGAALTLARLYRQTGATVKADAMCAQLMAKPDADIIAFVADFRASQGRRDEADTALAALDGLGLETGHAARVRARFFAAHGPADQVVPEYQRVIAAFPADATPRRELVAHLLRAGHADEAAHVLAEAAKATADDVALAAVGKHMKYFALAKDDAAIAALLTWCVERPADEDSVGRALATLADTDAAAADPARHLIEMRTIADRYPRLLPLQVAVAQRYLTAGKADDAAVISARAMNAAGGAPGAARVAAQTAAAAGRWQDALLAARAWRERAPTEAREADPLIAEAFLQLGNPAEAKRQLDPYLEEARADRTRFGSTMGQYARALLASGESNAAADLLRPDLKSSPRARVSWMRLAAVAVQDPADAATWLQEVEIVLGEAPAERLALAETWSALARRSKHADHQERAAEMVRSASEALKVSGGAEEHLALGVLFQMQGDMDASENSYRESLRRDPKQRIAQNNLAMMLAERGEKLDEALALATQAATGDHPLIASFKDTLAFVQRRMKREASSADTTAFSQQAGAR